MSRELLEAVLKNDLKETRKLIRTKKYDVNKKIFNYGTTLLTEACHKGTLEMVKLLIENGAKYGLRNSAGYSCVYLAKEYNPEVYSYLCEIVPQNHIEALLLHYPSGENYVSTVSTVKHL